MPPKQTEIASRLKAARAKGNFSQSQAAKAWGISVKTLQHWEQGWSEPRGLYLEKVQSILREAGV